MAEDDELDTNTALRLLLAHAADVSEYIEQSKRQAVLWSMIVSSITAIVIAWIGAVS